MAGIIRVPFAQMGESHDWKQHNVISAVFCRLKQSQTRPGSGGGKTNLISQWEDAKEVVPSLMQYNNLHS